LAARYAGEGPGAVVGFGLSNDERRGVTEEFAPAFEIARRAGLALVPHAGELLGPTAVETTVESIHPDRIGHGVRSTEDPRVLDLVADSGIALEVCPRSNVALGVYGSPEEVPLRAIVDRGIPVALGADDPLLFGSRLAAQYDAARDELGFDDEGMATLARGSLEASRAPAEVKAAALEDIGAWLAAPAG
jgi:adenosine deaminase